MSANVDKIVKIYKNLSLIPRVVAANFVNNQTIIHSYWSQRNIERGKSTRFVKTIGISPERLSKAYELLPVDVSNELLSVTSPSEKFRAVLRDVNEKQFLEIWQNHNLIRTVDLNALELHGDVYTDGEFGTFQWSPDETKLLYIAELKLPKSEPFYKRTGKKDTTETPKTKGEEYLYRQDWGEQLVGKKKSIIVQYNIETDEVEILNGIPNDVCPAQVVYAPDGSYVVGVAYKTEPRKLGLIYCSNRVSTIFTLDFSANYVEVPLEGKSVKAPIFTPDGKALIWLQRNAGGPHAACMALMKSTLPLGQSDPTIVVDVVQTGVEIENGTTFYGLYNTNFAKRCFASNNRLILSTNQKNTINTYMIDLDSGKILELSYTNGSQLVLDVVDDTLLVNRKNFLMQDKLAVCKIPPKGAELSLNWVELTSSQTIDGLENYTFEYLNLVQETQDSVREFSAIYLGPKNGDQSSGRLIVWPHGGPHSAFANNWFLECSLFLSLGFAVLLVNFRGSIGAGQASIDFLPTRIGDADVADCVLATKTVLQRYSWINPEKLALVGGSHGGFLVTSLSGMYPEMFKAVVARNPVTDIASMSIMSDIPDWCYVEAGNEYTQVGPINDDIMATMRKMSPIEYVHRVKAPTLLQLGSKDLRVPPHQGLEYYMRLKANGTTVRANWYDDNHPLGTVPNEMDDLINSVLWLLKYLE